MLLVFTSFYKIKLLLIVNPPLTVKNLGFTWLVSVLGCPSNCPKFKICLLLLVEKVSWSKNFTKINKIWIWIICLSVISLFSISISTVWVHFAYFDTNCLFCFFLLVFLFSNFLWIFEIFFDYFWLWQLFEKCLFW